MAISPPSLQSRLSTPIMPNNFLAMQSAQLAVTQTTGSVTFTNIPSTQRVTYKVSNTGSSSAYVAAGAAGTVAIASSGTPSPTSGAASVSNCDCIMANTVQVLDYPGGSTTFAAICASGLTTTLEISVGAG